MLVVNGVFVKKDNKATGKFPGEPIRYPIEDKPRHKPASQKQWLKSHSIDGGSLVPRAKLESKESIDKQSSIRHRQAIPHNKTAIHARNSTKSKYAW